MYLRRVGCVLWSSTGLCAGPSPILVYINYIYLTVEHSIHIKVFAEDCVVYTAINTRDDHTKLNNALHSIETWCTKWGLRINTTKTTSVTFSNKKSPLGFTYYLCNATINKTDKVKYLGVTLTSNLSWQTHIDNVRQGALQKFTFLKRKLRNTPPSVKLNACKALVRPKLEYADVIWSPYQQYLISKIERVQI